MKAALILPGSLQRRLEAAATDLLQPSGVKPHDFTQPPGEPALAAPDSVSWQVFKNRSRSSAAASRQ